MGDTGGFDLIPHLKLKRRGDIMNKQGLSQLNRNQKAYMRWLVALYHVVQQSVEADR